MKLLQNWYLEQTKAKNLVYDEHQNVILQQLDTFITNFSKQSFFNKIFNNYNSQGIYIYGNVGSGKSMIINELFQQIPEKQKTRIHFHQFMSDIHQKLANLKEYEAPLSVIAKELRQKYRIIFLDEMHVSDIATAMILKNLFLGLFQHGIFIVTSSNYAPDELYPDGLLRERFLDAIELIKQKLVVLNLNSVQDYRLINDSHNEMFIIGNDNNHEKLEALFLKFADKTQTFYNEQITIQDRLIPCVGRSSKIIWFMFDVICGDMRSQLDYLELSQKFDYIIIENITPIPPEKKDTARRLTWLVDIMYDNRKKLIVSSQCGVGQIYTHGEWAIEFGRTVSRLIEMQTQEYLTQHSLESIAL